jgi:hypothetical protein
MADRIGGDGAALVLPNSGSSLDDLVLGRVVREGNGQRIEDTSGSLEVPARALRSGDTFRIVHASDPDDPGSVEALWELEYLAFDAREGGEIEVSQSAGTWTPARLVRSTFVSLLVLLAIRWALGLGWIAAAAYHIPFLESLYAN